MNIDLTHTVQDYIIQQLSTQLNKHQSQLTKDGYGGKFAKAEMEDLVANLQKEVTTFADKIIQAVSSQLQQADQLIIQGVSEFDAHVNQTLTKCVQQNQIKSIIPHQPVMNQENSIINWMREVAENATVRLKKAHQQGDIDPKRLADLLGKIVAYRDSTLEAVHQSQLSEARKTKLIQNLLNKYQRSVEETVQEIYTEVNIKGQVEKPKTRKKLFGRF